MTTMANFDVLEAGFARQLRENPDAQAWCATTHAWRSGWTLEELYEGIPQWKCPCCGLSIADDKIISRGNAQAYLRSNEDFGTPLSLWEHRQVWIAIEALKLHRAHRP